MILLVLCTFMLGALLGSLVIVRIDHALLAYIVSREKKLESTVKGQKTFKPVIIRHEDTYNEEDKAKRLHEIADTEYEDNG